MIKHIIYFLQSILVYFSFIIARILGLNLSRKIFAFLLSWNEYALASIITRTVHSKTLPIGMMDYLDEFTINWAGMCAIAVVMIVPALILTFIVQKHLVSGLTFGGVKG